MKIKVQFGDAMTLKGKWLRNILRVYIPPKLCEGTIKSEPLPKALELQFDGAPLFTTGPFWPVGTYVASDIWGKGKAECLDRVRETLVKAGWDCQPTIKTRTKSGAMTVAWSEFVAHSPKKEDP